MFPGVVVVASTSGRPAPTVPAVPSPRTTVKFKLSSDRGRPSVNRGSPGRPGDPRPLEGVLGPGEIFLPFCNNARV